MKLGSGTTFRGYLDRGRTLWAKAKNFIFLGAAAAFLGSLIGLQLHNVAGLHSAINTGLWTMCIALALVFAFHIAQQCYLEGQFRFSMKMLRQALAIKKKKLIVGAIGGFNAGAALVIVANVGGSRPWWFVGWAVEGLILAAVLAGNIPNLSRLTAAFGGAIAGALGAFLLTMIAPFLGGALGVAIGDSLKGILLGAALPISETISRQAWIEVIYPGGESRNVTLGKVPVLVGSDSQAPEVGVQIFVAGVPDRALTYTFAEGKVRCANHRKNVVTLLRDGQRYRIGNIVIVTHLR